MKTVISHIMNDNIISNFISYGSKIMPKSVFLKVLTKLISYVYEENRDNLHCEGGHAVQSQG